MILENDVIKVKKVSCRIQIVLEKKKVNSVVQI